MLMVLASKCMHCYSLSPCYVATLPENRPALAPKTRSLSTTLLSSVLLWSKNWSQCGDSLGETGV